VNLPRAGLAGQQRFLEALAAALAERVGGRFVAAVVVQPRYHRQTRTGLGHEAAESLVQGLAERVLGILKPEDLVERVDDARLGLVLPGLSSVAQAELAATGILNACAAPLDWADGHLALKAHVGIAVSTDEPIAAGELLRRAELALERSLAGHAGYALYSPVLERGTVGGPMGHVLERELDGAIERDELHVCLQPKVCMASGRLSGAEALLRWTRACGQRVSPELFIPIAERSGLIVPMTLWTLNTALRACHDLFERVPDFSLAVNLSPVALNDPDIAGLIVDATGIWCADPARLILEITESALSSDPASAMHALDELHANGVRLSIDDFGTGYTSLSQLGVLSVSELKIDKSFVRNVTTTKRHGVIVRSVIDLAHNFGMSVVAEGIEDREAFSFLSALRCDYGQGFYLGRPMTPEAFAHWLAEHEATDTGHSATA
jgi:EAL domain-containing protein (putative c-di-GMP-specific phosphodiesterase class I)/GGDEF domain-containing protein